MCEKITEEQDVDQFPVKATDYNTIERMEERRRSYFKNNRTNPIIWGPSTEYTPACHGPQLGAHIEAEWTCPDHFGHDNYQRGHLPQLCIRASGWKARLLAFLLFWAMKKTKYDE